MSKVAAAVTINEKTLARYRDRLQVIKESAPALFDAVEPLKVSNSEPFANRVQKITTAFVGVVRVMPEHRQINAELYAQLQSKIMVVGGTTPPPEKPDHVKAAAAKRGGKGKKGGIGELPIMKHRKVILETIENNQVVLIRGTTGCGKTTQVPQFILDSFIEKRRGTDCRIVCTQPRRVAAISIADRVAKERGEELGGGSVGYLIRCENELPRPEGGHILYCTVGVLLRQLQSDPTLRNLTHIIVDEIHERSTDSDILLAVLKMMLPLRPTLRVIVMSATIQMDQFSDYFANCPTLEIDGFNHHVEEVYLDEIMRLTNMPLNARDRQDRRTWFNFIKNLIVHIHKGSAPGSILVFCSGYDEIERLYKGLKREHDPTMKIYILHSLVPVRKDRIFSKAAEGTRKIILSTNVAESSITIDDVVYVVDNGKSKVMSYNGKKGMLSLQNSMSTKANCEQRKGRAGRCQDGVVYRLYSREFHEAMPDYIRACVTRERLDSVLLNLLVWNFGPVHHFLNSLLSPPPLENVNSSYKELQDMGAVNANLELTRLGRQLANLGLEPQLGKMLIYSTIFNCVDPITTVVAFLSYKDIFMLSLGSQKGRRELREAVKDVKEGAEVDEELSGLMQLQLELDGDLCSDHMTRVKAVQEYRLHKHTDPNYCYENYLNESTLIQVMAMRAQIIRSLARNKFIAKAEHAELTDNIRTRNDYIHMIRSVICAGLYPNTAGLKRVVTQDKKGNDVTECKLFVSNGDEVQFHQGSVNSTRKSFDTSYFVYHKAVHTHKVFLHETTMVHSLALCLFTTDIQFGGETVIVDKFFHFDFPKNLQVLIKSLRTAMQNIFNKTVNNPSLEKFDEHDNEVLQLIADVLAMQEHH